MGDGCSGHGGGRRSVLLSWEVSADQEEPWRRLLQELQELSDARREEEEEEEEEYVGSRRRLGISAESVWLVPQPFGGGGAGGYLEALKPARGVGGLAASKVP